MPESADRSKQPMKFSPDDVLPPVEPPNLAFVRQLVLIPLMIVSIIVCGWLFFTWLASGSTDPDKMLHEISRYSDSGWQSASNLAQILSRPDAQYAELRRDPAFAKKLAAMLEEKSAKPFGNSASEMQRLKLCFFLCRALGNLETEEALPPLLEAAARERSPEETGVRLGALEGLTVLASHLGPEKMQAHPRAVDVLLECSRASDESVTPDAEQSPDFKPQGEVRGTAAFALGVIGGERAKERLVLMLDDPYASARYNAATGLARQGDARTIPVLIEMLDPDNELAAKDKPNEADRENRRINVLKNGIEAAVQLAAQVPAAEREKIVAAVRKIEESEFPRIKSEGGRTALRDRAREALLKIAKYA